ncbi:MAG: AMP-binding protein [Lautropia sp.]|nr:AMP-binding protein [Lautropia sp.]
MDRFWLEHYPAGVPTDIDPDQYASLVHLLDESMGGHGADDATIYMGKALSHADLLRLSRHFAGWLLSLGLARGARVALMMPNCHAFVVSFMGVLRAGMTVVNVNPRYTERELREVLLDAEADVVVVLENFAHTVEKVLPHVSVRHVVVVSVGDLIGLLRGMLTNLVVRRVKRMVPAYRLPGAKRLAQVLALGARQQQEMPALKPTDLALLQYTGGTSGTPKGAMLTHRNLVANVLQASAWFYPAMEKPGLPRPEGPPVFVGALPLYHIFALMICLLVTMRLGGKVILIPDPRDVNSLVKAVGRQKVVVFPGLSTLYSHLLANEGFRRLDFSNLRITLAGGAALSSTVAAEWLRVTGCAVCEGYGLTEASPTVCCTPTNAMEYQGTIGMPLPSTFVKIIDEAGNEVARGEEGELAFRGPQLMAGYWRREDETRAAMTPDGFFRSGDMAAVDERGYFRILDRKKDLVLVSGFNVYCNEVENVASGCPGVRECAAVGVPDEATGEAVKLFVVRSDRALTVETLRAYCAERLTGYKRPRHVVFVKSLPRSDVGKVLRRPLRMGTIVPPLDEA